MEISFGFLNGRRHCSHRRRLLAQQRIPHGSAGGLLQRLFALILSTTTRRVVAMMALAFSGAFACRSVTEPAAGVVKIVSRTYGMFPQQQLSLLVAIDSVLVDATRISWTSSDPAVVAVDSAGELIASNLGSAIIRAHYSTSSDSIAVSVVGPPEGTIVFVGPGGTSGTRLYAIEASGQNLRPMSGAFADAGPPTFSPNSTLLAVPTGYPPQVAVYDVATGGSRGIPTRGLGCGSSLPSWSPDATLLAFSTCAGAGFDIWVTRLDGTGQRRLTNFSSSVAQRSAFFPDGAALVVEHPVQVAGTFFVDLVKVSLVDGSLTRLTNTPVNELEPVIDQETARIIFVSTLAPASQRSYDLPTALFESDSALEILRQLTPAALEISGTSQMARFPTLSPDGDWIAFTSNSPRNAQPGFRLGDFRIGSLSSIHVMRRSDGLVVQLTDSMLATQPAWTRTIGGLE